MVARHSAQYFRANAACGGQLNSRYSCLYCPQPKEVPTMVNPGGGEIQNAFGGGEIENAFGGGEAERTFGGGEADQLNG
jgi:hypothetical protein